MNPHSWTIEIVATSSLTSGTLAKFYVVRLSSSEVSRSSDFVLDPETKYSCIGFNYVLLCFGSA